MIGKSTTLEANIFSTTYFVSHVKIYRARQITPKQMDRKDITDRSPEQTATCIFYNMSHM